MSLINFNKEFKNKDVQAMIRTVRRAFPFLCIIGFFMLINDELFLTPVSRLNNETGQNTVYKTRTIVYKPDTIIKYKETIRLVRPLDTSTVITAKNVNTGNNNGIIGDYGTINRSEQRHLDNRLKERLIMKIDMLLGAKNLDKNTRISMGCPGGDREALFFAREIKDFLVSSSYTVSEGIGKNISAFEYGFVFEYEPNVGDVKYLNIDVGTMGIESDTLL